MPETTNQSASMKEQIQDLVVEMRNHPLKAGTKQWITIDLKLKLITPMLGGGSTAGEIDRLRPIRPEAVSGAIRHWWWLLNRQRFGPGQADELFAELTSIWGDVSLERQTCSPASKVKLDVSNTGQLRTVSTEKNSDIPGYALWGDKKDLLDDGYEFSVRIKICGGLAKSSIQSILKAISVWITLGGVGARTSRGFGKVAVVFGDEITKAPFGKDGIPGADGMRLCCASDTKTLKSLLEGTNMGFVTNDKQRLSATAAWHKSIDLYKEFRQARIPATGRSSRRPGRSFWVDADTIRHISGSKLDKTENGVRRTHSIQNKDVGDSAGQYLILSKLFFGAPVVMKFKDDRPKNSDEDLANFDPAESTVSFSPRPNSSENGKFSSPIISTFIGSGNACQPLFLVLPYLDDIRGRSASVTSVAGGFGCDIPYGKWYPTPEDANGIRVATKVCANVSKRGGPRTGFVDPIQEFVEWVSERLNAR